MNVLHAGHGGGGLFFHLWVNDQSVGENGGRLADKPGVELADHFRSHHVDMLSSPSYSP
jgi:hypothetical protein